MIQTTTRFRIPFLLLILLLVIGTGLYHNLEGWSLVDSFYFTATTLTTIGYGDLAPTTDVSKLATVAFALSGVTVFLYGLSVITSHYIQKGQQFEEYEARKIREVVSSISRPFKRKRLAK